MPDFELTRSMRTSADHVYEFVSDVQNMPAYLPTTSSADSPGQGRVRVEGDVKGHHYESDGYIRRVDDRNRIEWGSDEGDYSGWIEASNGADDRCDVTVHLHFDENAWARRGNEGPHEGEVHRGLEQALIAIERTLDSRHGADSQMTSNRNRENIEHL